MIGFLPWRPDSGTATHPFADDMRNALPVESREDGTVLYSPFPEFASITAAVDSQVLGARGFVMPDGTVTAFVGTATKLYQIDSTDNSITDVSEAMVTYTASIAANWTFEAYGQNVVATNVNDGPQRFIVGTSTEFAALGGSPEAAHLVSVWKDQLVLGGLDTNPEGVQWSEINDITDWTGGNSDIQVFPGFGNVTAISRGNTPIIVQEYGIQRGIFTGDAAVFNFDNVTESFGCRLYGATVFRRNRAYFWSDEGFKSISPGGDIEHIGWRKIDRWARDNMAFESDYGLKAVNDPLRPFIYWYGQLAETGEVVILAYNIDLGEWSKVYSPIEYMFPWQQKSWTLDTLDDFGNLDEIPFSLDAPFLRGGSPTIGAFDSTHKAGQYTGPNKAVILQTGEFQSSNNRRSRIRTVRPIVDASCTVTHYGRENRANDFRSNGPHTTLSRNQLARINRAARWHKLQLDIAYGGIWTLAAGIEEDLVEEARW